MDVWSPSRELHPEAHHIRPVHLLQWILRTDRSLPFIFIIGLWHQSVLWFDDKCFSWRKTWKGFLQMLHDVSNSEWWLNLYAFASSVSVWPSQVTLYFCVTPTGLTRREKVKLWRLNTALLVRDGALLPTADVTPSQFKQRDPACKVFKDLLQLLIQICVDVLWLSAWMRWEHKGVNKKTSVRVQRRAGVPQSFRLSALTFLSKFLHHCVEMNIRKERCPSDVFKDSPPSRSLVCRTTTDKQKKIHIVTFSKFLRCKLWMWFFLEASIQISKGWSVPEGLKHANCKSKI